ncbi:MAG: bifunctional uridylyltransferase/uridylyl-removing protein, partial [Pseudomonadota bacterium]
MPRKLLSIPDRPMAPDTGLDAAKLRADLSVAPSDRTAVLAVLSEALEAATARARERFGRGRLDGLETARLIAAIHDAVVTAIWDHAMEHEVHLSNPTDAERVALVAVGGYGRG